MSRISAGANMSSFAYESGTYATTHGSAQWIGLVQDFSPDDTENIQRIRYHGTSSRNVDKSTPGARDHGGSFEYYPQDFRMLAFALGSINDTTTGSPAYYTHELEELPICGSNGMTEFPNKPFSSLTFETVQQCGTGAGATGIARTYRGAMIDSFTLSKDDNSAPLKASVDFIAKERATSGASILGTPTEISRRPYAPFDALIYFPSGTRMDAKTWDFTVSNNIDRDGAHVTNGSQEVEQPTPTERDYTLNFTMDAESTEASRLYDLFKSGGYLTENAGIEIRNFGGTSGTSWISFSGCDVDTFDAPNPVEGVNEWSISLIPKSCSAKIQDQTELYKPW